MRRNPRLVMLGVVILMPVVAIACGGSSDKTTSTSVAATAAGPSTAAPQPSGSITPQATSTPISPADRTVVAQGGQVPLVPFADPNGRFTMNVPQGWTVANMTDAVTWSQPSSTISATLSVQCAPGISVTELISRDRNIGANVGTGAPEMANAQPTQVAGNPAQVVEWSSALSNTGIDHVTVYFEAKGCAWRIQLNAFTGTDIRLMRPVLDGAVKSFTLL
jgi:hypothetical protein